MIGWIIAFFFLVIIILSGGYGWSKIKKEHNEIMSMPFSQINFDELGEGSFEGYFEGGMYKWRENSIKVTIVSGKITDVQVLQNKENRPSEFTNDLFERVINKKSLEVDTISGATLTSKAYLKGLEDALKKAQR